MAVKRFRPIAEKGNAQIPGKGTIVTCTAVMSEYNGNLHAAYVDASDYDKVVEAGKRLESLVLLLASQFGASPQTAPAPEELRFRASKELANWKKALE